MNLTAVIINFLREPYLYKCLESLREQYPDIKIIVGENGVYSKEKEDKIKSYGADYEVVHWDAGICIARNQLLKKVKTDYVLIGDDDFFYTEESKVDKMLEFLKNNKKYSLVGGRVREEGKIRNYQGYFEFMGETLVYESLKMEDFRHDIINFKECDITFNYFVARTKDLKEVGWDENFKVSYEHSMFFLDLKRANKKVVFSPDPIVVHKPEVQGIMDIEEYGKYRKRTLDKGRFFERNNIKYAVDMSGVRDKI